MGLLLDGVPVGVPASEAPPLKQTLEECAALVARDPPRKPQGATGADAARVAQSLRAIDRPRTTALQEPLPPSQRARIWDLRAPKIKTPG